MPDHEARRDVPVDETPRQSSARVAVVGKVFTVAMWAVIVLALPMIVRGVADLDAQRVAPNLALVAIAGLALYTLSKRPG